MYHLKDHRKCDLCNVKGVGLSWVYKYGFLRILPSDNKVVPELHVRFGVCDSQQHLDGE